MKYGELNNVVEALKALRTQPQSFSIARKLKDVCDDVDKEVKWFSEQMNSIVEKCAKKDENGKPEETSDGGVQLESPKEFERMVNELLETETGEIPKIKEEYLQDFKISTNQLDALLVICEVSND